MSLKNMLAMLPPALLLPYATLDDPRMLTAAVSEPGIFFKAAPPPLVLDEIQYAPQLFPHIKMILDSEGKKGQFFSAAPSSTS